jgi:subfamily B ATP-binding cassette protein MsbA
VRISEGTVCTDTGELLRGGAVWVYKYGIETGVTDYAYDPAYYRRLRAAQVNAVRVICFDPWQKSHNFPFYDVTTPGDLQRLLRHLDRVVQLAGEAGLYALINYHDVGGVDHDFADAFWRAVAPRYAHETHVFYELLNEPVQWFPEHYTPDVLAYQEHLYHLVRGLAPQTHLVLLTFPNTAGFVDGCTMETVVAQLATPDWSNASVAFHAYYTGGTSAPIRALRERVPVINTEICAVVPHDDADKVKPMDGDDWGSQTMERLGISWFAWLVDGHERFESNFEKGFLIDARRKGYVWSQRDVARLPIRACSRVMGLRRRHLAALVGLSLLTAGFDALMLMLLVPMIQGALAGDFSFLAATPVLGRLTGDATFAAAFLALAGLVFATGLARNAAQLGTDLAEGWLYGRFSQALSVFAYERYLTFGRSYFDRHPTGTLNARVDYHHDVLNLYQAVLRTLSTTLVVGAYLAVMLFISWRLTLVALVLFPLIHATSSWILRRNTEAAGALNAATLDAGQLKWQMMAALPLFRATAFETQAVAEYRSVTGRLRDAGLRLWTRRSVTARLTNSATLVGLLAILTAAVATGRTSPPQMAGMLVFFFVVRLALPELARFQSIEADVIEKLPKVREFAVLFDDHGKGIVPSGDRTFGGLQDAIEFRSLTFRYPGGPVVLSDIDLRIDRGATVAIVGPSGAGKSTLTHLLMRFYDVPAGRLLIDGIDIRDYATATLRRGIAVVSQDVILLNQSLRKNLMLGLNREVPDDEIVAVLKAAQLEDLLAALPHGLDTSLGDSGSRLSAGQQQRVAIARALLTRASILILDEATSALDSITETQVQHAIEKALHGRTSLVIAHRLSTIRTADHILVLDAGRVVESGTLAQLLEQQGLFRRLWEHQAFS